MDDKKRQEAELRQEAAKVDADLLGLLDKRAKLARRIGEIKEGGAQTYPLDEESNIDSLIAKSNGDMPKDALRDLFRGVFANCLALEMPVPVVFVGGEGGMGHSAARSRFGVSADLHASENVSAALDEVIRKRAQFAVVPFETRIDGPVHSTIAALIPTDLKVVYCFDSATSLDLVSKTGNAADVEKVYATAADHILAERYLAEKFPKAQVMDVKSPLVACRLAAEDHGGAALAASSFGDSIGLRIVQARVQDESENRVRYAVVGQRPSARTGKDSTAIVMSVNDAPGALHAVLKQFADRDINLSKIQSRPMTGETWAYLFLVEVAGHVTDRNVVTALEEVKRLTKFVKVLGSYPAL